MNSNKKINGNNIKNIGWLTSGKYKVFKEYNTSGGGVDYEFVLASDSFDTVKEFCKAVSGTVRTFSYVISDDQLNIVMRYPSVEVLLK
ncbi:MAG: hypothetical protein IIU65_04985 [Clostridia bacterium]|nr:hypothetical protein [Clostridia bacterium]